MERAAEGLAPYGIAVAESNADAEGPNGIAADGDQRGDKKSSAVHRENDELIGDIGATNDLRLEEGAPHVHGVADARVGGLSIVEHRRRSVRGIIGPLV